MKAGRAETEHRNQYCLYDEVDSIKSDYGMSPRGPAECPYAHGVDACVFKNYQKRLVVSKTVKNPLETMSSHEKLGETDEEPIKN